MGSSRVGEDEQCIAVMVHVGLLKEVLKEIDNLVGGVSWKQ